MLRKRNEYPTLITPKGEVAWASLSEPDYEYKAEGEFHVRLRFDPADPALEELITTAEELLDEAFAAKKAELEREKKGALLKKLNKAPILPPEVNKEDGEETGFVTLRAGMKYHIEIKKGPKAGEEFFKTPDVFDAKRVKLRKVPKVGPGSELKLSIRVMEYFFPKDATVGIRFELEAVQIIKLVQGGERNASGYGFGEEDGDSLSDTGGFDDEGDGYEAGEDDSPIDEERTRPSGRKSGRDF